MQKPPSLNRNKTIGIRPCLVFFYRPVVFFWQVLFFALFKKLVTSIG